MAAPDKVTRMAAALSQVSKAETFRDLHHRTVPFLFPNDWDPLGAAVIAEDGFPAVATASSALALPNGIEDGENLPFSDLVGRVDRIVSAVSLPVSVDFEPGYAVDIEHLVANTPRLVEAGAIGANIEDSLDRSRQLRPVEDQALRIAAIREVGEYLGVPLVINARTDAFAITDRENVDDTLNRVERYATAGADAIFPILCKDLETLTGIREASGLPVSLMLTPDTPSLEDLSAVGVRRISTGPSLLGFATATVRHVAHRLSTGDLDVFDAPYLSTNELRRMLGLQ